MTTRPLLTDEEINRYNGSDRDIAECVRSIYEARIAEDAKVRAQLVEAIESLIYDHGCGTTYVKCKSPDCAANIGRAALAAAKEIG